jgi:hypothetical protein
MKDEDLGPVDPSLAALFAAERGRAGAPAAARARVLARLEASITGPGDGGGHEPDGGGSPPPGGAPAPLAGAAAGIGPRLLPLLGAFVIGGAAGAGAHAIATPPQVVYVDRPALAPPAAAKVDEPAVTAPAIVREPEPAADAAAAPTEAPRSSASPSASSDAALAAERALLDVGRTALGRSDGAHALEAAARHAREFPRGQLSEEREAIAVQALVKLGRRAEAEARGERFRQRYPNSVLMPVIDAALARPGAAGENDR